MEKRKYKHRVNGTFNKVDRTNRVVVIARFVFLLYLYEYEPAVTITITITIRIMPILPTTTIIAAITKIDRIYIYAILSISN